MFCFEDTSQDTCVIHKDTEPLETQSFIRRLFNVSLSTADVILTREVGGGVYCSKIVARDYVIGIANRYGLDGTRIESRWGARSSAPLQTAPGTHPLSLQCVPGLFPGEKVGRGWP